MVGGAFVLWGLALGLVALHDNSFLTHLATGRLMLRHGIPTRDPYSYTASGAPWVVESWLASLAYALVERLGGGHGLVLLHAALAAVLAGLVWVLSRPAGTLAGRVVASAATVAVGTGYWSPRPLLIALVLLGVVVVMAEGRAGRPWMLVPLMWVWVNVHGSWPVGLVYLVLRMAGRLVERRPLERLPRLAGAMAVGVALGAANPYGLRLLTYPLVVVTHHEAFAHIVEWQSPRFSTPANAVFLVEALAALVLLVARRGRAEDALVVVVFGAGALLAARNVPVAALVTTPVLARGLAGLGTVTGDRRSPVTGLLLGSVGGALGLLMVAGAMARPAYDLVDYPVAETAWMQAHGVSLGAVIAPDYVGNYLEFRDGPQADVFIDDRADMYPARVEQAFATLQGGGPGWQRILTAYRPTALLWPRRQPLARLVARDPAWRVVLADRAWVVAVPRTESLLLARTG